MSKNTQKKNRYLSKQITYNFAVFLCSNGQECPIVFFFPAPSLSHLRILKMFVHSLLYFTNSTIKLMMWNKLVGGI